MGTIRWDAAKYGKNRGSGAATVTGEYYASGTHSSSSTASNLTDGAAGAGSEVSFPLGVVVRLVSDTDGRFVIGGATAANNAGYSIEAGVVREVEITASGKVSVIDGA